MAFLCDENAFTRHEKRLQIYKKLCMFYGISIDMHTKAAKKKLTVSVSVTVSMISSMSVSVCKIVIVSLTVSIIVIV